MKKKLKVYHAKFLKKYTELEGGPKEAAAAIDEGLNTNEELYRIPRGGARVLKSVYRGPQNLESRTASHHITSKPQPVQHSMRESLKQDVDDIIKMGVIRESNSPYASQVVVVQKKR